MIWSLRSFNFVNITLEFIVFLQFNLYCKMIIKFLIENTYEKHDIVSKRVFERNLTNKINLEGMRKI